MLQNKLPPLGERRLSKSGEVEWHYREYDREYQDQQHKMESLDTARRERQGLEQQLTRKVTEAKAAIWRLKGEQQKDRYNGSWYSIVPSEAQLGFYPILDEAANRIIYYRICRLFCGRLRWGIQWSAWRRLRWGIQRSVWRRLRRWLMCAVALWVCESFICSMNSGILYVETYFGWKEGRLQDFITEICYRHHRSC